MTEITVQFHWIDSKKAKHECEQWFEAKEYEEENATIKDLFRQWYQKKKKKKSHKVKRNELRTPFWIPAPDQERLNKNDIKRNIYRPLSWYINHMIIWKQVT